MCKLSKKIHKKSILLFLIAITTFIIYNISSLTTPNVNSAMLSSSYYEYNGASKPTVGSTVSLGGYTWTVVGNEPDGNPVAFCGII